MLVWSWKKQKNVIVFVRRRIGFDEKVVAFDVGVVDEVGAEGLCVCELRGTEVTNEMRRHIKEGSTAVPLEFWHASVTCDWSRFTYARNVSMTELEHKRRTRCLEWNGGSL